MSWGVDLSSSAALLRAVGANDPACASWLDALLAASSGKAQVKALKVLAAGSSSAAALVCMAELLTVAHPYSFHAPLKQCVAAACAADARAERTLSACASSAPQDLPRHTASRHASQNGPQRDQDRLRPRDGR